MSDEIRDHVIRTVTIELIERVTSDGQVISQCLFNIQEGDGIADHLAFDEMLGQIVSMLYSGPLMKPRFRMLTAAERAEEEAQRERRRADRDGEAKGPSATDHEGDGHG
jgi:hypothetical protein